MLKKIFRAGKPKSMDMILGGFAQVHRELQEHSDYHSQQIGSKVGTIELLRSEIDDHRRTISHSIRVRDALTPFLPVEFSP